MSESNSPINDKKEHNIEMTINKKKKALSDEDSSSKQTDTFSIETNEENLYNEFVSKLDELKDINIASSIYFEKKNACILVPTILLTAIGSIISFLSASTYFEENVRIALGLTVGIITILSSLLQSFQTAFKFKTKSEMFRNSADQFEQLIIKIKFELAKHDEKDFIDKFEKKLLEISSNCKYFPPQHIIDQYNDKKSISKLKGIKIIK